MRKLTETIPGGTRGRSWIAVLALAAAFSGCSREKPGFFEQAGKKTDQAVEKAREEAKKNLDEAKKKAAQTGEAVADKAKETGEEVSREAKRAAEDVKQRFQTESQKEGKKK
jgi:ElaB/YqjD/DUF883 family membrane-anchored ribosome-binding protein